MISLKSKDEIELMREVNIIVHEILSTLEKSVEVGINTADLDDIAAKLSKEYGVVPAFPGYPCPEPNGPPFSGVICTSLNEAIVHGIPSTEMVLKNGDIISIDYGCELNGFFGDSAITVPVGEISDIASKLLKVTKCSLDLAIEQCVPGGRIGDIGHAVQCYVEENGFQVVHNFVGHGIGRLMHEPPQVPNFGRAKQGRLLKEGMVLAIEPMVTIGNPESKILSDNWTAVTKDGSLAAHFEHSVAITSSGPYVLSRL